MSACSEAIAVNEETFNKYFKLMSEAKFSSAKKGQKIFSCASVPLSN